MNNETVLSNYSRCVDLGAYNRVSPGLFGKYDNVRRIWEDQINRFALRHFFARLFERKQRTLSRVRILDMGAGAGEGYEIITNVRRKNLTLESNEFQVMPEYLVSTYKGVDISPAMVEQARANYVGNPKVYFEVADLNDGLPVTEVEPPYDIYFSSFGSLSHLSDESLRQLIVQICDHIGATAILVLDLLGKYSYEWPCYWNDPPEGESKMRPYSMSYLHPPEVREQTEIERFPLRYWGGDEIREFVADICAQKNVEISMMECRDRSLLVGRHMNTQEYNPDAQPLRQAVCSLHEFHRRTDLNSLLFDYLPSPQHPKLNSFFENIQMAWNSVVGACIEALNHWEDLEKLKEEPSEDYPEIIQQSIRTIRDVVRNVKWFRMGDPLANIIEPQLGYILRNLSIDLQQGFGAAHGLLVCYELTKN